MTTTDPQRYRVTIMCSCAGDYTEGFGATREEATANAHTIYRREHGKRKPAEVIVDCVTADGSHYEEERL